MQKKISRFIAGILFACMIAGSIPAQAVYGDDNAAGYAQGSGQEQFGSEGNTDVKDEEQQPAENEEIQDDAAETEQINKEESSDGAEEIVNEETDVSDNANDIIPSSDADSAAEATVEEKEAAERAEINFVYIESPYLETPGTQRIVFSFDREITEAGAVTLTVENETGVQEEWGLTRQTDHLYLFEKEYTGDSYTGTYHAVSLNFYDGENESIVLKDAGVEAEFGVNEKYDGIEELQPVEDSAVEESGQRQVDASVVTIDENGVTQAQDSIADALNAVSARNASENGISTFSADASSKTRSARSGDIVVALDPGHDAWDAGARGNGLVEEELTLKIANYCKEELEQYAGVSVYMTRTGPECPYGIWGVGCIEKRVQAAAAAGAQIFVSFHLNSSVSSSANGAEVIVPNYSWKYSVGTAGHTLGQAILDELVKLGLTDRGIYSKDTTINERYPDGSISDYFGVQIYCKEQGIPGIIVEHAFISNSGDANRFLTTEAGLKQLGVADATGIAKYLGLSKGRWETDSYGNTCYYENSQKVYGQKQISGKYYFFDWTTGYMVRGWYDFPEKRVYYGPDGAMRYGQQKIDGKYYCFDSQTGAMITGWYDLPGKRVYYASDGTMVYGEQEIDGKKYYFDTSSGAVYFGWTVINGRTRYYFSSGNYAEDQKYIDGKWYYFEYGTGYMVTGWYDLPGKRVYYGPDGAMWYNQQKIDGNWYYFDIQSGAMATGWCKLPGKTVYYGPDGAMLYGKQTIDGIIYYFDTSTGAVTTGWITDDIGKKYYTENGGVAEGQEFIDGKWYYFEYGTGYMVTGWYDLPDKRVYYGPDGVMRYGQQKINGKFYCFDTQSGEMITGWYDLPGKKVYYGPDGAMWYDQKLIDGKWYYFDTQTGAMVTGWYDLPGKRVYYGSDGAMRYGQQKIDGKFYCFDSQSGAMIIGWHDLPEKRVYYGPDGAMWYDQKMIDGKWYYFDIQTGAMAIGWCNLPGKRVYYGPDGAMRYGQQKINGKFYCFDSQSGAMITGWYDLPGKRVYYGSDGAMRYGQQKIDGKFYCFDSQSGAMITGWYDLPGKRVYYGPDGAMWYDQKLIDGKWYYFDTQTGAMAIGWCNLPGKRVYYGPDGAMRYGEQEVDGKYYYFDMSSGAMLVNGWHGDYYYGPDGIRQESMHLIQGKTSTTVEKMVRFYNENSPIKYPAEALKKGGAPDLETFCRIFVEEAGKEGIKAEVVFSQTLLETGYLKFGGQVKIEQFNFAGLGATDGGASGADFSIYGGNGVRMGVRAQVQHMKAYASSTITKETLKTECVDPRFDLISPKGCAPYVEYLGQKENPMGKGWATAEKYGYNIIEIMNRLLEM